MATTSFEAKFGILADSNLGNKLPAIRKSSLGFQVVAAEDDNEKALGVLASRLGNRLVYVPMFWLGGRIKGGEIMYLKEEDTFRPFTEVWVNYISTGKDFKAGKATGKEDSRKGGAYRVSTMDLNWLHSKRAGEVGVVDVAALERMGRMADTRDGIVSLKAHLQLFSPKAAADLANALVSKASLANALFAHYTPSEIGDILGNRLREASPAVKKAASPTLEVIQSRDDIRVSSLTQAEKVELAHTGVVVRDSRKEAAEAFVVKQDAVSRWAQPSVSGVYDVLTNGFDTEKRTIFVSFRDMNAINIDEYRDPRAITPIDNAMFVDAPEKKMMLITQGNLPLVDATKEPQKIEIGEPVTAEALRALLPTKRPYDSFSHEDLGSSNRIANRVLIFDPKQAVMGSVWAGDAGELVLGADWAPSGHKPIILTGKPGELFQSDCWYVPSTAKMIMLADYKDTTLSCAPACIPDSTMISSGYVPVKVACDNKRWDIASRAGVCSGSSYPTAVEELVVTYGLRSKQARDILDDARTLTNGLVFYVKAATDIDAPIMGDDRSNTKEIVPTKGLSDASVQNIVKASQKGVKEVLDISVLKEMADSRYPLDRVTESLPVLTKALDRLCRNLFYFYWHNEVFEDRFGKQSLDQLEESLKENIQAIGDLVMYLQEKESLSETELLGGDKEGDLTDNMR